MRPERIDHRYPRSDVQESDGDEATESPLTSARRVALDALEREFHDLLGAGAQ